MKAPTTILLTLTAAAALLFAQPASANLITNGGFETGDFTGWPTNGGFSVTGTIDGIGPHSGSFQAASAGPGDLSQFVATIPGQSYIVTFWLASSLSGHGTSLHVAFDGSNIVSLTDLSGFSYTKYTATVTTPGAITGFGVVFTNAFGATGHVFFDDVSVTPAGVPDSGSTVSLLGCALFGLAALRRKLGC